MNGTFARIEEGFSNELREYNKKQIVQLNTLISLLLGHLNDQDREKITTLCLIDLHARDVVAKMLALKVIQAGMRNSAKLLFRLKISMNSHGNRN